MFELAPRLLAALDTGAAIAVATAVDVRGSAPSGTGTSMALLPGGRVVGTVSGGCVEGALFETAEEVLATGTPVLAGFGFEPDGSDDAAENPDALWAPALRCGGRIEVLVHRVTPDDHAIVDALRTAASGAATSLGLSLEAGMLGSVVTPADGCRTRVFTEYAGGRARCIVVGAVEFAVAVTSMAAMLGYAVTVVDPRPVFLTDERFPAAQDLVVGWPPRVLADTAIDERTVVVVLSHDDRFDAEVLDLALRRGAGYVGAMGSRSTHESRLERLRDLGTPDLGRLRSPIGLDIGATTPAELALAVMAEVVTVRTGHSGRPLVTESGPIHERLATA
ncbi:XdhC family protein [Curtobacterium sp. ISL-83]|uniref:XdhC family protein n=1 Tax=Curtobacterium sp. ISL-83 TaxID=2819145 RepID=UPI001BE7A9FD|nr:XdhC/CoxI family protein [Curtobacterium sp. ISL-83]MBT2501221.1 XdhC family protein [Curtobacterium sp. ISL-83]